MPEIRSNKDAGTESRVPGGGRGVCMERVSEAKVVVENGAHEAADTSYKEDPVRSRVQARVKGSVGTRKMTLGQMKLFDVSLYETVRCQPL